jgi:hypothetical protein
MRLAPGQRRQRRNDGAHIAFLHHRIAITRFNAPHGEHDTALNAKIAFDARQQRVIVFRLLPAGEDAPVGHAPIEILPKLFGEFGLAADRIEPGRIRA